LRTAGKLLTDIADTDHRPRDIIAKHVGESAKNLIQKFRGRGRKRPALQKTPKKLKKIKPIKTSSRKSHQLLSNHGCKRAMCEFRVRHIRQQACTSTFDTPEIAYKPITSVDQSDLEIVIPPYNETYIDLNC
jgi:hypothetical protein